MVGKGAACRPLVKFTDDLAFSTARIRGRHTAYTFADYVAARTLVISRLNMDRICFVGSKLFRFGRATANPGRTVGRNRLTYDPSLHFAPRTLSLESDCSSSLTLASNLSSELSGST